MSQKSKVEKSKDIEQLLKESGFSNVRKINNRIIHADGAEDFGKAHAAFLKAAGKHSAYVGCSEFPSLGKRILIVHVKPEASSETSKVEGQKSAVPEEN